EEQLVACEIGRKRDVHETARREQPQAERADIAGIEALHEKRYERNEQELGKPGPGQHVADLLGVVRCTWPRYCGRMKTVPKSANPMSVLTRTPMPKLRLLRRRRLTSGL